jgi:CDP-glucose 4,6-dehydratase
VIITTDKVYANKEWEYGYREVDQLGGHDPYSASKAAAEIAVDSWRSSFCGNYCYQTPHLSIATARAGNVVGGGDWSVNRLVPDAMRALEKGETIKVRNPKARRPWQHVLEPLSGYLMLAERLSTRLSEYRTAFNFGPTAESNRSVEDMIEAITHYWPTGVWEVCTSDDGRHEAEKLHLQIDKAFNLLGWSPKWEFDTTVKRTVEWYRDVSNGADAEECCLRDIAAYTSTMRSE